MDIPIALGADGAKALKVNTDIANVLYVFYYLRSIKIKDAGYSRHFKFLKDIQIPLPPLEVQVRIAHLLGKVEGLIAQRKKDLSQLDQLLKSVFLEMFGDPVRNEKGWERSKCKEIAEIITGYPFKSKEYTEDKTQRRLCGGLIIMPDFIDWENGTYWMPNSNLDLRKYELKENDIVFAMDRPWISNGFKIGMIRKSDAGALLVQRTARLRAIETNQLFLYSLFKSGSFKSHCKPTETTVPHISIKDIESYLVIRPPLSLQNRYADIVEKIEIAKSSFQKGLTDLESLYGVLSQKAFQGELDLSRVSMNKVVKVTQPLEIHANLAAPTLDTSTTESEGDSPRHVFTRNDIESALQKLGGPRSFPMLMAELEKIAAIDRKDYEDIRALLYQMLSKKQLTQVFDETQKERVTVAGKTKEDAVPMRLKLL